MPRWFTNKKQHADTLHPDPEHRAATAPTRTYDLDEPLLAFSPHDQWRVRDALEGCQIFGATGSGKTSGSGQAIAKAFLLAHFGGLVLCAKPDECALWQQYARETDREDDLIIFSPSNPFRFNFLDYELNREGSGSGLTENLVALFTTVVDVADRKSGRGSNDDYWQHTLKQLLRNAIDLLRIARGTLTLHDILQVIISAPTTPEELRNDTWQKTSFFATVLNEAFTKEKSPLDQNDFNLTLNFWAHEFTTLAEKTRSIIISTFTSMADGFLRGIMRELFSTTTNIKPEYTHNGAIIIMDLAVKEYNELGQYAQVLFKYIWQRATERRHVTAQTRPVFLWADGSQFFTNDYDMLFQTTARSARAATVFLTQNINNYYAVMGQGEQAKYETDSFLGNLQTKIFHANGDSVTNTWAADMFGQTWQFIAGASTGSNSGESSSSQGGGQVSSGSQTGGNVNQTMAYSILPRTFTTLRKGGTENDLCVDALVFQGGRRWRMTDDNYIRLVFSQDGA